jgi:uncharacterized surface protein with fasciclin (FAS1) repeats
MRKIVALFMVVLLMLAFAAPSIAQDDAEAASPTGYVRVSHLSPGTPPVVIFVNGEIAFTGLRFGNTTRYVEVEPGTVEVAVGTSSDIETAAIGPIEVNLNANEYLTVAAIGAGDSLTARVINAPYGQALPRGNARITLFHAIEDAPAVDVWVAPTPGAPAEGEEAAPFDIFSAGSILVNNLAYPGSFLTPAGPLNDGLFTAAVPAGSYEVAVVPAGARTPVVLDATLQVTSGSEYLVVAAGSLSDPDLRVIETSADDIVLPSVLDIASGNDSFSTLVAAVQAANPSVLNTLSGQGPFTIFAPTNEAFEATLSSLGLTLDDVVSDTALLTTILRYHIVGASGGGAITYEDLANRSQIMTLANEFITVGSGQVGGVPVVTLSGATTANVFASGANIAARNGVIHVIDRVLVPASALESDED